VVILSTIGAQALERNLLTQLGMVEQELYTLPIQSRSCALRGSWRTQASMWPRHAPQDACKVSSALDKPFPMVATEDVGRVAAELLQQAWLGRCVVELEGPRRVTPWNSQPLSLVCWGKRSRPSRLPFNLEGSSRTRHDESLPRMRMLDGFNEGWIEFEATEAKSLKGTVELETVLKGLIDR